MLKKKPYLGVDDVSLLLSDKRTREDGKKLNEQRRHSEPSLLHVETSLTFINDKIVPEQRN